MVTYISRDYSPASSGYLAANFPGTWSGTDTNRFSAPIMYHLSLFLTKILGFTTVGQTSWNIDNTNVKSLVISAATNTNPITATTVAPHGLTDGDVVNITGGTGMLGVNGSWKVIVVSPTQFTLYGSGGNGTYNANTATMTTGFQYASGLTTDGYGASINFGVGFLYEVAIPVAKKYVSLADVGKPLVLKSVNYPTKNNGIFKISGVNLGNTTTVAAASNGAVLPQGTINVVSTSGFPTSGTIFIGTGTTIAAGSNGAVLPQATINVASTSGFPTSGTIFVVTSLGSQTVTYTGTTATSFTGCTGGAGTMSTGGAVTNQNTIQTIAYTGTTATTFTGCTGGVGTLSTGAPVTNLNRYVIDYRSTDTPPPETGTLNWWLYEIETIAAGYMIKFANTEGSGTGFAISSTTNAFNTTIAVASNGLSLPQSTINVASTTGFPATGVINVTTSNGPQIVNYVGTTATTFTNCTGGTGTMSTGGAVSNPIIVQTNSSYTNTWITGQQVTISGHATNTNANGNWTITQATNTSFALNGSVPNAAGGGTGSASLNGYLGGAAAANSRVIYQSPHSSGWQIRLCAEPERGNLPRISFSVGYGGTSIGEFPALGTSSNILEYFNINPSVNTTYTNFIPGLGTNSTASRMTMMGDGYGQSVIMYTRTLGATNNGFLTFGISDNEPVPTPNNLDRLFVYGGAPTTDSGTIILRIGTATNVGNCLKGGLPSMFALTGWANLDGTSATSPLLSANAGDSPFTGTTELLPIENWAASVADVALSLPAASGSSFNIDQRFMGTAPMLRNGRTNFGNFTLSTESIATSNINAATNTSPIQITTTATNALATGQTVVISGVTGNTAANGTFTITVINNTQFTLNGTTGNGAYIGGGTVTGTPRYLHLQNGIFLQWNGCAGLNA